MTAIQLNAELYRAMGEIANDETLLAKVLKYVKSLTPAKTAKAEAGWADHFAGAWKDSRSAEEIISDIRDSRTLMMRKALPSSSTCLMSVLVILLCISK